MDYQMLVLDLDGTLTNSRKELTEPTKQALIEIQEEGKKVVLASGRPINGIVPLAEKLNLSKYGGYMLSFNGARITQCSTGEIIYNRTLPADVIAPIYEITSTYPGLDILTYDGNQIRPVLLPTNIPKKNLLSIKWKSYRYRISYPD